MDNYIVSARKYRPMSFDSVVGQQALTTTLKNAIASEHLAHAYLFCGPRGVGKTTCARIFAKTINCMNRQHDGEACNQCESCISFNEQRSYNIIELDAASNNGVEDIKTLMEQTRIPPQVGKYKVFIIDEVHMLSQAAFNAFLKTLEEPPAHVIFILATTEKQKILPTILSRCQVYDFKRMEIQDIVSHLQQVAQQEGYTTEPAALNVIAEKADGGMRDALSIFDQVASFCQGNITYSATIANLNVLDYNYYFRITEYFLANNITNTLLTLNDIVNRGFDMGYFITGLAQHFRNMLVARDPQTISLIEASKEIQQQYMAQAQKCKSNFIIRAMKLLNNCDLNYKQSKNKRLLVELTLIEVAQAAQDDGESAGHRPAKILKPIFKLNVQSNDSATANNHVANKTAQTRTNATSAQTMTSKAPVNSSTNNVKAARFSISGSIKLQRNNNGNTQGNGNQTNITTQQQKPKANKPLEQQRLASEWILYAKALPQQETAMAKRLIDLESNLAITSNDNFEVLANNPSVAEQLKQYKSAIEQHLRERLDNANINMTVRIREADERKRAYSRQEQFLNMCGINPNLKKLREKLNLDLS
ncbi:MAG: DNA polymerase III subunit gamma/tau [Bacteroidaceae bacterium]|nr:DNA polymerase III subunit gamma/tau [Bacteroidaceae bacterium]